jgi:hypothetical protein
MPRVMPSVVEHRANNSSSKTTRLKQPPSDPAAEKDPRQKSERVGGTELLPRRRRSEKPNLAGQASYTLRPAGQSPRV